MSLITQLKDICPTCGKIARTKSIQELSHPKHGVSQLITLECNHVIITKSRKINDYSRVIWDVNPTKLNCFHNFDKNECVICGAHRLYPFQSAGAQLIELNNGRFLICDEQGLGKTIQALAYLKLNRAISEPFLWVTTANAKYPHGKEIIRIIGNDAIPQPINTGKDVLWKGMNLISSYAGLRGISPEMFIEHGIKTLILDECQAIKNPDALQTKAVRRIAEVTPQVIGLSGTPWKNRASEFFTILNILDPKMFYNREVYIRKHVNTYISYAGKETEGGLVNPKEFWNNTKHIIIRRERKEVMPELPLVYRTKTICEVAEHARKAYNKEEAVIKQIMRDAAIDGDEGSFENARKLNDSFNTMRQIIGIAKVPATVELAKEFLEETDRKLVIFTHHLECMRLIHLQLNNYCSENNLPEVLKLSSDLNSLERMQVQDTFNKTDKCILVASTLAGGVAINLQTCQDFIMHERQWNPPNEEQAEGRFPRIGIDKSVTQINGRYMHADNTIDLDLDNIVESKRREFHNSMNKTEMPIWEEKNIMMEIARRIMNKK